MNLWAISDLHVGHPPNAKALLDMPAHPSDWLILGGDLGEREDHLRFTFDTLGPRFAKLIWVPGNHELYTTPRDPLQEVGPARYARLVELARDHGVLTPEDPWPLWPGDGPPTRLAPTFLLYDYSFGPDGLTPNQMRAWAAEAGIYSADERYIDPSPYPDMGAWSRARVEETERRLRAVTERVVLINHWPLRQDLVRLGRIQRFLPWCGSRATEAWHTRYPIDVVVNGHLHMRATDWRDGVRFEEVALGYPRHWHQEKGIGAYLRRILPRVPAPDGGQGGPVWHR
ncbi:MAG: metallophosphoesterase [Alphaproteobacteria bacterium]|nr:metallophosphoesterase [Alphaproteobacteria bacterium]